MITPRLQQLTGAMAEFEGWYAEGSVEGITRTGSVSYRNHNPGNLRHSVFMLGVRDGFAYFQSDYVGQFAMDYDIMQKCRGKTVTDLNGESTIYDLIRVYSAEPKEKVEQYVTYIEKRTGFSRNDELLTFITKY